MHTDSNYINPLRNFQRWLIMVIMMGMVIVMCSSCSYQWHLKRAIKKNPELSLTDTVSIYQVSQGPKSKLQYPILTSSDLVEIITPEKIKVQYVSRNDTIYQTIECPPDSIITREIPKIVKIQLTEKEIFDAAKQLSEWKRFRIGSEFTYSAFIFGFVLGIIVWILIRKRFK